MYSEITMWMVRQIISNQKTVPLKSKKAKHIKQNRRGAGEGVAAESSVEHLNRGSSVECWGAN